LSDISEKNEIFASIPNLLCFFHHIKVFAHGGSKATAASAAFGSSTVLLFPLLW
jgi:hypothetical protein